MTLLFHADSALDLKHKLAKLDITVLPRSRGRTTQQTERYAIAHLLSSLPSSHLPFPLVVEHGDRPDCVISTRDAAIGIELTEAVPANVAHASAMRESGIGPDTYFIPRATPGERKKSTAELREEIELDAPGAPWMGNAPEREWAEAMFHFVRTKVAKVQKPGFTRFPCNWLVIYDNWPLPSVRLDEACSLLADKFHEKDVLSTFDRVFVLTSRFLCEVGPTVCLHPAQDP